MPSSSHISSIFATEHTSVGLHLFYSRYQPNVIKHVIKDGYIFCVRKNGLAVICRGDEDLFQGNFANNNTCGWRDL